MKAAGPGSEAGGGGEGGEELWRDGGDCQLETRYRGHETPQTDEASSLHPSC